MTEWKLVPVEPTEEMVSANHCECGNAQERDWYIITDYQSMPAAAPKASEDEALVERVALQLQQWDWSNNTVTAINRARVILKMLEGNHEDRS